MMQAKQVRLTVLFLAAMALVLMNVCWAAELGPTTTPGTYFGVDANDKEAVAEKQRELGHEKWREMMGDVDINQIDFSPEIADPTDFLKSLFGKLGQSGSEHLEAINKAVKNVAEKVHTFINDSPEGKEIREKLGEMFKNNGQNPQDFLKNVAQKLQDLFKKN